LHNDLDEPRSAWIYEPDPFADHFVFSSLSTALNALFPLLAPLEVTDAIGKSVQEFLEIVGLVI
jgi:hypothetical protein